MDKIDEENDPEALGESVSVNRRYKVAVLDQVREIVREHIGGTLAPDDWEFGLWRDRCTFFEISQATIFLVRQCRGIINGESKLFRLHRRRE